MLLWVLQSFQCTKYARLNIGKGEGAYLSENQGVKSECKKLGKNSRQMSPVSTICDEYCSSALLDRGKSAWFGNLSMEECPLYYSIQKDYFKR